jgi:prepilin signal peptidase PulO-like enzyme (type II secretory pathway)
MILFNLYIIIIGFLLGSFIYTLALRMEKRESVLSRSHCDHCSLKLGILDLIPLAGFILRRGKCSSCGSSISLVYPLTELFNALLVYLIFSHTGWNLEFLHILVIFEILYLVALIDFSTHLIYPQPILFGLLFQAIWLFSGNISNLLDYIIGLCVGAGIFHWISYLYQNIRRRSGLGTGDATLLGFIGFCFGWELLLPTIFWSSLLGIVGGGSILLFKKSSLNSHIAFGPWIALAALLVWRFPDLHKIFLF